MKSFKERIENLRFYGGEDNESYELFASACGLAYQTYGIGEESDCEWLVKYAERLAAKSYEDTKEYQPDWLDESIQGVWGYQ